ncbi:PHD-finger motif containing protein [Pseudozyma hubeiensis SY62]|uniref:PHD-finger motif containing protein n=1 Tax=Pseudozyma hubeiensis (strain SY62) TaxID=1305764 RepID=R9PBG4_PSEHS|nr:PHD-finger motif containing protein [Pseudozyma hubeiensis SY62]GAC98748.1 PHD-finger motif containing protein [Pseudozyma hubeiensis SY62]
MPARRSLGAVAGPSATAAAPVVELHPITKRLRKMWKFAAVCQFLFVFDEAFGMSGFETEALELDFENNESNVVPDLIKRLLYTLTLDRTIDFDNWQHHLRAQFNLRDVDATSRFGTSEQPIDWAQLCLEDKIATLHDLCEWQLMDPERFRKLVKSEEDITTWRVSPIGWDAGDNAYWLFDDNRIWIQRPQPLPKPPAKTRAPAKKGSKRARMEAAAARRASSGAAKPITSSKSFTSKRSRPSDVTPSSTPSKRTRSSLTDSAASTPSRLPPRRGTRTSARFAPQEDEAARTPSNGRASRTAGATYSSDSELSEPPETLEDDDDQKDNATEDDKDVEMNDEAGAEAETSNTKEDEAEKGAAGDDDNHDMETGKDATAEDEWVEFEAIVVTRQEWLDFAKRFAKSKDPNEKNLHQFINNEILEQVLEAMDEVERQRALELALANRKRSSRIAIKESEREERERDREARARMEEKMALIRKEEEQKRQREEEDQQAQISRETRLREREERLRARELEIETKAIREEEERERRENERQERIRRREEIIANGGIPPPSKESTPVPEDSSLAVKGAAAEEEEEWELNCEVCGKAAISPPDEDDEIVCCEQCGVWQHIKCWDSFDKQILGLKKKRDWESVDFFCSKCRPPSAGTPAPHPGILSRRDKSSPRSNKRTSDGAESPSRKASEAVALDGKAESPRPKIKLVSSGKAAEPVKMQDPASVNPSIRAVSDELAKPTPAPQNLRPPTAGAQPAETGALTSSGAASRPIPAKTGLGQLPPPSSHSVPNGANDASSTVGRPLLPAASIGGLAPTAPSSKPTNGSNASARQSQNGPALGMGRPTQPPQLPAISSPRSPSSGGASPSPASAAQGNGASAMSPRSPSCGATLGSPGFRRPSQPSGSFPMRHTPAKSPLSRPYDSSASRNGDPPTNGFSLGPARASSPSASRGTSGHFASLGATAQTLHPSSASADVAVAAAPNAPSVTALGNVFGHVFSPASSAAGASGAAAIASPNNAAAAAPAPAETLLSSPSRLQASPAGPGSTSEAAKQDAPRDVDVAARSSIDGDAANGNEAMKPGVAAASALRTLELGLQASPVAGGKAEPKQDGNSAAKAEVVELPPTHIQSP